MPGKPFVSNSPEAATNIVALLHTEESVWYLALQFGKTAAGYHPQSILL